MSPVTSNGSATLLDNGALGAPHTNGGNGLALGADGSSGGGQPGKRVLPHIDDLTSVTIRLDPRSPFETVLSQGESYLKQAQSSRLFGRADLALKDYLLAFEVALQIKQNKAWVALQVDKKSWQERYNRLVQQINADHAAFEKLKEDIKADNARTGVLPTKARPRSNGVKNEPAPASGIKQEKPASEPAKAPAPSPSKAKPAVHPKPAGLHGNAIKPTASSGGPQNRSSRDLELRFAALRPTKAAPVQDPRIRTQTIIPGRPAGPRDMPPPSHRPSVSVSALPDLPKIPDAVYSPARGTISNEAASLPSSTPRGFSVSRTNSIASVSTSNTGNGGISAAPPPSDDYFVPTHISLSPRSQTPSQMSSKRTRLTVPDGDTISVQDLVELMQAGAKDMSILLVDIRSRDDYDEGHIMSQSTICIEPEITTRDNVSADQISESLIINSTKEQQLFEKRHEYDLVVFYDQESTELGWKRSTVEDKARLGFFEALGQYDYAKGGPRRPKLLAGGLEAWINVMGPASLASTPSSNHAGASKPRSAQIKRSDAFRARARPKYVTRPIQDAEEARRWEETLTAIESDDVWTPARTTDDFLRRYPSISTQESMTSPVVSTSSSMVSTSYTNRAEDILSSLPSAPTRPAPLIPRASHSGLHDADHHESAPAKTASAKGPGGKRMYIGLENPGNWCYANSSLQSLFATEGFSDELANSTWATTYTVPPKDDEKIQHPQLLSKIMANLFHWLQNGTFPVMKAQTLMAYVNHIHREAEGKDAKLCFGALGRQQDAQEFLNFLITYLHDETNMKRNINETPTPPVDNPTISWLQGAVNFWEQYSKANDSIVDRYWRGVEGRLTSCRSCKFESLTYAISDLLTLGISELSSSDSTLQGALRRHTAETNVDGKCDGCRRVTRKSRLFLPRLPDRLIVCFTRFMTKEDGSSSKVAARVDFPLDDLDMEPYWIPRENNRNPPVDQEFITEPNKVSGQTQFHKPFRYHCYAVVKHHGSMLEKGHYTAYIRQGGHGSRSWVHISDRQVEQVFVRDTGDRDRQNAEGRPDHSGSIKDSAYIVFYRRQPMK